MVEANKMKSKTNEGPLVRSKSNEGPLVQTKSVEVTLAQRRLSKSVEVTLAQRRLSSQSTASVKASKRASLGLRSRPSVAKTNNKIDLKKTNSYVNSLNKAPPTKVAAVKCGDYEGSENPTIVAIEGESDEILEKHTEVGATKDGTVEFLENETDRFQLVNALEAILAQPSKNLNSHTDQPNIEDDQFKSDVTDAKAKNDPSKFKEEIKSKAKPLKSVNDKVKTISHQDKSSSTSRSLTSDAKSKSAKASKGLQTLNTRKPSTRSKLTEPALNPTIHVKTSTDEVLAVSKISGPRNSTGSAIRSSKCAIKPNRASLSPKKISLVNRPTKVSTLPKSSYTKPIRTSTPKACGPAKSTRSVSVSPGEDLSGSTRSVSVNPGEDPSGSTTPLLKSIVSNGKSGVHTVPKKGSMENLNSKILTSNKTVSMPNLCNIQQIDQVKSRSNSTKKPNVGDPKLMEIIEQKFGLKLEGVTARNKLVIAKIVEQVEGIEHSLKLTNRANEDELQKQRDELQRQRIANEQLKKNNELLENCHHKIKETMADREEEMMREIIAKNSQIEELKIFSMKNTDFLNHKLLLKDEDAMELNDHIEKLKIILIEKDNLLQEAFDQQAVYQEKIKQYENSEKLKDELMDDMMTNHKNEIETLGLKISDKDRIAKDLKLKVSKLIAEFTKEFKEKDEEIKMKNEQLKFKTKEASNAIVQNKLLGDDLVKIKKVLSDRIRDLELCKTLNHEQTTVIENLNQQLDNLTNEINQQSIIIDNLTKEISDSNKEVIEIEHVDLAFNPHVSVADSIAPVEQELIASDGTTNCANTSDIIKGDNPEVSAQNNIDSESSNEVDKTNRNTVKTDDSLDQKIQSKLGNTGDAKPFESISKEGFDVKNIQESLEPSQDTVLEAQSDMKTEYDTKLIQTPGNFQAGFNMHKEEKKEIKRTFEPSEDKIAEVPAHESLNQINQTDMETEIDIKMIENSRGVEQLEFKTQAVFDILNVEPSKEITVQVQADESLNQIHQTDNKPQIDVNMIETSGDERFVMLMEANNEIKQTFEPSKDRIVEVEDSEWQKQRNQTDVETKLDRNLIQTSRVVEQFESNSQARIDIKLMYDNKEMKQSFEKNKDIIVDAQTNESLNQIDQTDLVTNFERKLNQTLGDVEQLEYDIQGGFDMQLKQGNLLEVQMDESLIKTNMETKLDFKTIQSFNYFQQTESNAQAGFDMKLKDEINHIFEPSKNTIGVPHADEYINQIDMETKVIETTGDVESLEPYTKAGFGLKLKEKNRKIIIQTLEPIQDIIIEVSKHTHYENAPKVEECSTLNGNYGFAEGFETVTSMTKNGPSSTFQNSCDPSSYSLADFDVSLNILENKRSLRKKRKEFSPFCEVTKEDTYTQDDFVEHVLNLESIEENRTGVVKSLIRDFEELATDSKEDEGRWKEECDAGASALKK